jgi:hypothetical protein
MYSWLIAEALEITPTRQWFVYGAMLITVACGLLRTAENLWELFRLYRFGQRRAAYYAAKVWRASPGPLRVFLMVECLVVDTLCVLVLIVLSDVTLW